MLLTIVLIGAAGAPAVAQDDVAAYLDRLGLRQILAVHLEQQLAAAEGEEREAIALRLAPLYSELLETVADDERRALLTARSRELIRQVPEDAADELRLALLRAPFRAAERTGEQYRLRQADEQALVTSINSLQEIIPEFERLRDQFDRQIRDLERRRNRASGIEQASLNERLERLFSLKSDATFLQAWSLYYLTLMSGRDEHAREAQYLFSELLNLETPEPRNVSVDLRGLEPVARSILGLALCKSQIASTATAFEWLDLLEGGDVYEPVREQLPAWRLVVLLEHGEFTAVHEQLLAEVEAQQEPPVFWLRLAVVHALETSRPSRPATDLVRYAVTELAARSELQEVLDLASRYGIEALGGEGFAMRFVDGVIKYNEARETHGSDHPATDRAVLNLFSIAEGTLSSALQASDATAYRQAAASCHKLLGWARYFQGKFLVAREAFELAAGRLAGDEASQALWMAIVCLDKVVEAGASAAMEAELAALIERFLDEYPSSEHAPKLVLKRAATAPQISREMIDELLAVPPNSEIYAPARSRAAGMLYQLFRDADDDDAAEIGNEYLNVAVPLINLDDTNVVRDDGTLWPTVVAVRSRRILEVSLRPAIARLSAARRAFETLDRLQSEYGVELAENVDELDYRRLELRLLERDITAAADLADTIYERASESIWSKLASRALFRNGFSQWTGSDVADAEAMRNAPDNRQAIDLVIRYGLRVIAEYENDPTALQRTNVASYYLAVGDASLAVWRRSRSREDAETALRLFDRMLNAWDDNAHLLRSTAELCEALDQKQRALELWRRLAAGLDQSDEAWYEARWHQIDLLRQLDPPRAREVMDQHKQLYPELGPPPWDERMRELDLDIPQFDDELPPPDDDDDVDDRGASQ